MKLPQNMLLALTLTFLLAYWSVGWLVPPLVLSLSLAVFSMIIGGAVLVRYASLFWRVLVRGERSGKDDGAHLAALGIPSIGAAIVWGGMFTLLWNINWQPDHWLGTPVSNFSRVLLSAGCVSLFLTPDVERQRLALPGVIWLAAIGITAVVAAFALGAYVGSDGRVPFARPFMRADFPSCPVGRPVWGARWSMYYHTEASPYRAQVLARRCFLSEEEAQAAGFQPVPVLTSEVDRLNFGR